MLVAPTPLQTALECASCCVREARVALNADEQSWFFAVLLELTLKESTRLNLAEVTRTIRESGQCRPC